MVRISLYQPDIAQNLGTTFRTAACFGIGIDIIEPCGFPFDSRKFKRAGMDYIDHVDYVRHNCWEDFKKYKDGLPGRPRLILLSSKAHTAYTDFQFKDDDILLLGRESAGVPDEVADFCDEKVTIPMQSGMRSLNVAISAAIVLSEAIRQTAILP